MTKPTKSDQEKNKQGTSRNYKVIPTDNFFNEARALEKKYPNIKQDFLNLKDVLKKSPEIGVSLGAGIYKVEMIISDKKRGKSESARVIIQVLVKDKEVYVLHTYDKAKYDTVITKKVKERLKKGGYY